MYVSFIWKFKSSVNSLCIVNENAKNIVISGSSDKTVKIWELVKDISHHYKKEFSLS
jgi:hypothetical protein